MLDPLNGMHKGRQQRSSPVWHTCKRRFEDISSHATGMYRRLARVLTSSSSLGMLCRILDQSHRASWGTVLRRRSLFEFVHGGGPPQLCRRKLLAHDFPNDAPQAEHICGVTRSACQH